MPRTIAPFPFKKSPPPRPPVGEPAAGDQLARLAPGGLPREAIAAYAHYIWEQEGRPAGQDREHWLQAEAQLRWALLNDDLQGITSQSKVRRKLWDQSVARFGPVRSTSRKRRPS